MAGSVTKTDTVMYQIKATGRLGLKFQTPSFNCGEI